MQESDFLILMKAASPRPRALRKGATSSLDSFSKILRSLDSAGLISTRMPPQSATARPRLSETSMHQPTSSSVLIPNYEPTKFSLKKNGQVRAYAATTNQGLVRSYNEDRVSIILNIMRPVSLTEGTWPKCSFFGVYDGHGGAACADFLRDHLHQFIIKAPTFPWNPKEALRTGFREAEKTFVGTVAARSQEHVTEKSGSCALVMLVVDDWCYVANVGDSRAIMSGERGKRLFLLSKDHKPGSEDERKRISEAGGSIYQSQTWQYRPTAEGLRKEPNLGPVRLLPGRLSVSRSFGDAEAKIERFGGNPSVLIATPDIRSFKISSDHDFVLLGCDGIFDMMTNKEAVAEAWSSLAQRREATVHRQCSVAVENVLRSAMERRSMDNVTVVMVAFKGFKRRFKTGN